MLTIDPWKAKNGGQLTSAYKARFGKPPVICISVSTSKTYRRTDNQHPVLGVEYQQSALSSTDHYFA